MRREQPVTLKNMVKIKVKVIIISSLETIQLCYWTFSPKCILTENIRGVQYFSMTLFRIYISDIDLLTIKFANQKYFVKSRSDMT